jgi:uncharacterized protein (DUF427 family)
MENQDLLCEVPAVKERTIGFEPVKRKVKVVFNGATIVESEHVILVREEKVVPVYYFPLSDVNEQWLVKTDRSSFCNLKGTASYWHIKVDGELAQNAIWTYEDPIEKSAFLKGYVAFYWKKVQVFEENEQVFGFPRDPKVRIDTLHSTRAIKVVVNGETLAESRQPVILFETGMAPRYFLPKEDVRLDKLTLTDKTAYSPYKGTSEIWTANINGLKEEIAVRYSDPAPEALKLKDLIGFYQEKAEAFYIDGEKWEPVEGEHLYLKGI